MHRTLAALALGLVSACSGDTTAPQAPAEGRILHYVRSNIDGTRPELISVYQSGPNSVAVFKRVQPCNNAALVTGEFDPVTNEAIRLTGGQLAQDGTQAAFIWLRHDADADTIAISMEGPDGVAVETRELPSDAPWRLYDFDFADFNGLARPPVAGEDLVFDMALAWPAGEIGKDALRVQGIVHARWTGEADAAGTPVHVYTLDGAGMNGGTLQLNADDGTVVLVESPAPNHPGYDDYALRLTGRDHAAEAWQALLAAHWDSCADGG